MACLQLPADISNFHFFRLAKLSTLICHNIYVITKKSSKCITSPICDLFLWNETLRACCNGFIIFLIIFLLLLRSSTIIWPWERFHGKLVIDRGGTFENIHLTYINTRQPKLRDCLPLKGNLAHNFMISSLALIPCLLDMVKTLVTENGTNIDIICIYRGKEI